MMIKDKAFEMTNTKYSDYKKFCKDNNLNPLRSESKKKFFEKVINDRKR